MQLNVRKSLNKAYLKAPVPRQLLDRFIQHFGNFVAKRGAAASEEFNKSLLADFLKHTYYAPSFFVNVNDRIDLAIHVKDDPHSPVGVIIETKRYDSAEMARTSKLDSKAIQELLLYYLRERAEKNNHHITHLIITNFDEWFIFDALEFDRLFYRDATLVRQFRDFASGRLASITTEFFYKSIASPAIATVEHQMTFAHFTTSEIEALLKRGEPGYRELLPFVKVFSPEHMLKLPFQNDNNSLNKNFFDELLHIIGLEERRDKSKKIITRKADSDRDPGSLIENTIAQLQSLDRISGVSSLSRHGAEEEQQLFSVALELSLTWLNRVLFLKLLEAQLLRYHGGDRAYAFLNSERIRNYGDLNALFFQVLAEDVNKRHQNVKDKFPHVPYLNSSLFEVTELERQTLVVSNLLDGVPLSATRRTVLKSEDGRRFRGNKPSLEYLFEFLDAYDFASDGGDGVQEGEALISASVLGLIFEKINGYRDGSFFTPGFITMEMASAAILRAVVTRFSDEFGMPLRNMEDVYNAIPSGAEGLRRANEIFNTITVCDPAVGSGHFLVSALNELLAIKSRLGILVDGSGRRLKDYVLSVENDELVVTDEEGQVFTYVPGNVESQRVQETIFNEKRRLIEGSLFGVDLNSNSVNICRLRLWIELLKHSFYRDDGCLETLPNLDINIKVGNSLLSRFPLDSDLRKHLKKHKTSIADYRKAVQKYKNARDKAEKRDLSTLIQRLKSLFTREFLYNDPLILKIETLKRQARSLESPQSLFGETAAERQKRLTTRAKYLSQLRSHQATFDELVENKMFEQAFEWRIEFPEVLDSKGAFVGFDVILGNPPYVSAIALKKAVGAREYQHLRNTYSTARGTVDLYVYFFELAARLAKPGASICYITPNRYLSADYGTALRSFLIEDLTFLGVTDYSRVNVFESAATYPVITHLARGRDGDYMFSVYRPVLDGPTEVRVLSSTQLKLALNNNLGFLLSEKFEIAKKVMGESVPLTEAGRINATSTAAEADSFGRQITEGADGFKLINTGTIDRYEHAWGRELLTHQRRRFKEPRLVKDSSILGNRLALYSSPKIIFAKIALRNEAVFDVTGELASINTNCIHSFSDRFDPFYILAWVNSRLFQYTYECLFDGLRMAGRFLPFTAPYLSSMYIMEADAGIQNAVGKLAAQLMDRIANQQDTGSIEREIDLAFYSLYRLDPSEIEDVDTCFELMPLEAASDSMMEDVLE